MGLIFIVLIGVGIYFLVMQSRNTHSSRGRSGETALDILERRFASGEITKEEFEEMKRDLIR